MNTCLDVQVFRCTSVQIYKCSDVQVFKCTSVQMYKCSDKQVFRCTRVQIYTCSGLQVFKSKVFRSKLAHMYKYLDVKMLWCTFSDVQVKKCLDVKRFLTL